MKLSFFIILLSLFCVGCEGTFENQKKAAQDANSTVFPPAATNIVFLNDDWATFEYEGQKFIIHRKRYSQNPAYFGLMAPLGPSVDTKHETCPVCRSKLVSTPMGLVKEN